MILIKNLIKKFGNSVVVDIDELSIQYKEIFGLIGNNGAGKTTMLRIIVDLIKPERGSIYSKGVPITKSEKWKAYTSAFIDNYSLIDFLKPLEYLEFIGYIQNISIKEIHLRLRNFEALLNGEIFDQKFIRMLSSGNKQKVGIIGALITKPELLILDEPFNYLDPTSQIILMNLLLEINKTDGTTMIISSHNLSNILEVSTKIGILEHGRIVRVFTDSEYKMEEIERYFKPKSILL